MDEGLWNLAGAVRKFSGLFGFGFFFIVYLVVLEGSGAEAR